MFAQRPIIGIAGGIGSGKTFVARLLGELGCYVIESDRQVRAAYNDSAVRDQLRAWWGDAVFSANGEPDRSQIAAKIFHSPADRQRLESLLHPRVAAERDALMSQAAKDPQVLAFVWDTPLLFETGLNRSCDAIIYIDTDLAERIRRVALTRGWSAPHLAERENLQWPLDKKKQLSHYVLTNTADADSLRIQAQETLSRIIEQTK